jgi:imidazolonepropionase-like amidohydrolase
MRAVTLTGLRIWNGERLVEADAIRIEGQLIAAVGDSSALSPDSRVIPFPGAFAMPGLIDAHVHLVLDPENRKPPARDDLPDPALMRERARQMLAAGITTARDLGGGHWREIALRDDINKGRLVGPRLLCAGQPLTSPGGHCHFWGGEAADSEEIAGVIERQLAAGADLIKVMATGGRMTAGSQPVEPQFDTEALGLVVTRARSAGRPVAAHCHGTPGIQAAATAGVDTIEHCSWVGAAGWASDYRPEVARLIAARGVRISPTINSGWRRLLSGSSGERMSRALKAMTDLGIALVAGTDAGIPGVRHDDLPAALPVFRELLGASPEYVLKTATSGAADALGLAALTGRLAPGLAADIVLLDGNALESLDVLARPVAVFARGARATD